MPSADLIFPAGFRWGAGTSAYQVEGAVREDGRGPSIWDEFAHTPGRIANGDTGDIATDHYHRWRQDIDLLRELGLNSYRFSVAWPRIFPTGRGRPNAAGLDHYRRLVDALNQANIAPMLTLYHWDLPQALQDAGGWANRDTVYRFAELAHTLATHLGDSIPTWTTINEPWVIATLGSLRGIHAPGGHDLRTTLQVAHHLLLAHGAAVPALRAELPASAQVGIVLNLAPVEPAGDSQADADAADREDAMLNRWYLDPLYRGRYPDDLREYFGPVAPVVGADDLATISVPTDYLGINYYRRLVIAYDRTATPIQTRTVTPRGAELTATGWEVSPRGLYDIVRRVKADYSPPAMIIAENGAAFEDKLIDGQVDDPRREIYLRDHLTELYRAIADGAPVTGYYVWSLLDNFEWSHGYAVRFGIVYVDYATQERTIKRSGHWYGDIARENGLPA